MGVPLMVEWVVKEFVKIFVTVDPKNRHQMAIIDKKLVTDY